MLAKPVEPTDGNGPSSGFIRRMSVLLKRKSQMEGEPPVVTETAVETRRSFDRETDSVFSSIQSDTASYALQHHVHTAPALRTVQLGAPAIVHTSPPSPPPSGSPGDGHSLTMSPQMIEEAFDRMLAEYAWPATTCKALKTLPTTTKQTLLYQHQYQSSILSKKAKTSNRLSATIWNTLGLKRALRPSAQSTFANPDMLSTQKHRDGNPLVPLQEPTPSSTEVTASLASPSSADTPSPPKASPIKGGFTLPRRRLSLRIGSFGEKMKTSPEYFVTLLKETPVRELEEPDLINLRIFLRNMIASWTTRFLAHGGYEALANQLKQMTNAPKRVPQDNKTLQHLIKCLKAIMTHESGGSAKVLTELDALIYIRKLLFMPTSHTTKAIYGFDIETRHQLLDVFRLLTTIEIKDKVHGYDVMRWLLLDRPEDEPIQDNNKEASYPFPMSIKPDSKSIMQRILEEEEPGSSARLPHCPRYTSWMNELFWTVEHHIGVIGYYATAMCDEYEQEMPECSMSTLNKIITVEEGVVDYLILHLKIANVMINEPVTTHSGHYGPYEQEKMRLELMLSGLDKVAKVLWECPHSLLYGSYVDCLRPLDRQRAVFHVSSDTPSPLSPSTSPPHDLSTLLEAEDHPLMGTDEDLLWWETYINNNMMQQALFDKEYNDNADETDYFEEENEYDDGDYEDGEEEEDDDEHGFSDSHNYYYDGQDDEDDDDQWVDTDDDVSHCA